MRLKYLLRHIDERLVEPNTELLSVSKTHGVVPRAEISDTPGRAEDLSNYKTCQVDDLVINRMSAYQGALGIAGQFGAISPDYMVLRTTDAIRPGFAGYLFKSHFMISEMSSRVKGIGSVDSGSVRTPRLNWSDLGQVAVDLPPADQQESIAAFLDRETAKIDALIAKQEQLITTLDERRRVKVSGVIAEFSEKASSKRVSAVAQLVNGFPFDSELFDSSGEVPLVRIRDISSDKFETFVPRVSVPGRALIRNGDVVVGMDGDFNLRLWDRGAAALNQRLCLLRTDEPVIASWIAYCLPTALKNINDLTYATTVKHLSSNQIARIMIPMPSVSELNTVVRELDRYVLRIERLVQQTREMLTLLRERRQSLISAAVTGKLERSI